MKWCKNLVINGCGGICMSVKIIMIAVLGLSGMSLLSAMSQAKEARLVLQQASGAQVLIRVVTGAPNTVATDITLIQDVDCIVNAANEACLGGGGVDGAVHKAAGTELVQYIKKNFKQVRPGIRCPTGSALVTPAFNLQANRVQCIVHAVGPRYENPDKEHLLNGVYSSSLHAAYEYAQEKKIRLESIAFPSISTGIFGYPIEQASTIAVESIIQTITKNNLNIKEVRFVVWNDNFDAYKNALEGYEPKKTSKAIARPSALSAVQSNLIVPSTGHNYYWYKALAGASLLALTAALLWYLK